MKPGRLGPPLALAVIAVGAAGVVGSACAPRLGPYPRPEPAASVGGPASADSPEAAPAPPAKEALPISPRAKRLAESVCRAFSNVDPRPVTREMAQQPWVLFQTDRAVGGPLGPLVWREAPVRGLHGKTEIAREVEPCAKPLVVGEPGQARGGSYRLERGAVFDRLYVDGDKIAVKLPPGASHGGCLVDEKRLWLAWSTPARPAELFTITLKDGVVRPLRDEARPLLGALADLSATDEGGVLLARRANLESTRAVGVIVWVDAAEPPSPLGAFSPLVRAFVEEGYVVLRRGEGAAEEGKIAALVDDLVRRDRVAANVLWTARLGAAPLEPPAHTLWIDPAPAEREKSLAQALTALAPEPANVAR